MSNEQNETITPPEGYANDFYRTSQEAWYQLVELENLLWMYGPPDDPRGLIRRKVNDALTVSQKVAQRFEPVAKEE
jgi:hypothetical protein